MKRYFILFLTVFLLFGCSKKEEQITTEETVSIPFVEVKDANELNTALGFTLETPESIDEISDKKYYTYEELLMAEVEYFDSDEHFAYVRKVVRNNVDVTLNSVSGIYEKFDRVKEVGRYKISFIDGIAYISDWQDANYMYSLVMLNGASEEVILEISKLIK